MSRPKKTEPGHEIACRRWRRTMEERYGGKEGVRRMMQKMGAIGGRVGKTGGFYASPERAVEAGSKGGTRSRKGYKFLGQNENGDFVYRKKDSNEEYVVPKEEARNLDKKILRWMQSHPTELSHLHSDADLSRRMSKDFATPSVTLQLKIGKLRRDGQIERVKESGETCFYKYEVKSTLR